MTKEVKNADLIRFGSFELSHETGQLRKNGVRIRLSGQPIEVLTLLLATPGKLVTREHLQSVLWNGNAYGDFEKGLNNAINRLGESLDDSATEPKYIETVPGRGYRFIGQVEPEEAKPSPVGPEPPKPHWKWKLVLGIAACATSGFQSEWASTLCPIPVARQLSNSSILGQR